MVKQVFKIVGLSLLVIYLLMAGVIFGFWREEPRYRGIKVEVSCPDDHAHFVTEASILQLVRSMPGLKVKGKTYGEVNTYELARYIEEHNRLVRHATCYHTTDSLLRIDIEQRNPVMRVMSSIPVHDGSGKTLQDFYIDDDSEMMPAQFGTAICLPLATGYVTHEQIRPLRAFAAFLKDDDFWRDEVTQIYVAQNGDISLVPRVGNHTILIGSFDNLQTKLDNVRTFYDEVLPRRGWNAFRVINVKFNGQVIGER